MILIKLKNLTWHETSFVWRLNCDFECWFVFSSKFNLIGSHWNRFRTHAVPTNDLRWMNKYRTDEYECVLIAFRIDFGSNDKSHTSNKILRIDWRIFSENWTFKIWLQSAQSNTLTTIKNYICTHTHTQTHVAYPFWVQS